VKFTVDRKTWYRGHASEDSSLLRSDGTRCCIGFVGQQCGIEDRYLLGKGLTLDVTKNQRTFPVWMHSSSTHSDIGRVYAANDSRSLSDPQREAKLKEIFARNGDEIEFVD
jgi:hypothetical protein